MANPDTIGELRPPAADIGAGEPRHRAAPEGDPWFRSPVPAEDYLDASRRPGGAAPRNAVEGIGDWSDDGLTMPGVGTPIAVVDPNAPAPQAAAPSAPAVAPSAPFSASDAPERSYRDIPLITASTGLSVDQAADEYSDYRADGLSDYRVGGMAGGYLVGEPVTALAAATAVTTEDEADAEAGEDGEGPAPTEAEDDVPPLVALRRRIALALATPKGKWVAAAIGVALALVVLSIVLATRSSTSTADVQQASDSSPTAPAAGGTYPAPSYPNTTPGYPAQGPTDPTDPSISDPGAAFPSSGAAGAVPPDPTVPPGGLPADDPMAPSAPLPPDPAPYDPDLDSTPTGADPTMTTPGQDQFGNPTTPPRRKAEERPAPRDTSPLGKSLDSITAPHRPASPDRGDSDTPGQGKSFGKDLPGGLSPGL